MKVRHIAFVFCVLVLGSCGGEYHKENQEQPVVSPSGKYVLTVPIETAADKIRYWRVTISDVNGNVLFKDDSEFVGRLNVYWSWDAQIACGSITLTTDIGITGSWIKRISGEGISAGVKDRPSLLQLALP
jgi:hypothetical protein